MATPNERDMTTAKEIDEGLSGHEPNWLALRLAVYRADIQAECGKRAIEKCKAVIMGGYFLSKDAPDYKWAVAICNRIDENVNK